MRSPSITARNFFFFKCIKRFDFSTYAVEPRSMPCFFVGKDDLAFIFSLCVFYCNIESSGLFDVQFYGF